MSKYRKRGDPTGEWRTRPAGEPTGVPPAAVILDPGLSLAEEAPKRPNSDPYNRANAQATVAADPGKRRSLDDMRTLSDAIKSAKSWAPPRKAAEAAADAAVASLRASLARMLTDIAPLTRSDEDPTHPQAIRALQFRNIAAQLQQLLDCLLKLQ